MSPHKSKLLSLFLSFHSAVECPELESPQNGTVSYDDRLYPNNAEYSCDDGFELEGEPTRMCQLDGEWTEEAPSCEEEPTPEPPPSEPPAEEGTYVFSGRLQVVLCELSLHQILMYTEYTILLQYIKEHHVYYTEKDLGCICTL